jgi:GxxExxY protein
VSQAILAAACRVHARLGPGLLESAYKACLAHELKAAGLAIESEKQLPVIYEGVRVDVGYRLDLIVESVVIVEVKAVERLLPVHEAQLLSYLRLSGTRVGLLINFNVAHLRHGIRRRILGYGP